MYFNNFPQGFGLPAAQQPQNYVNQPMMGNAQVGGIPMANKPALGTNPMGNYQSNMRPSFGKPQANAQQPQTQYGTPQTAPGIGGLQPFQQAPQMQNFGGFSTAGNAARPAQPISSAPRPMAGQAMARGGVVQQTLGKSKLVSDGIAALRGQHPNPRAALDAYDREFGRDATAELMRAYADGGVVSGPGSGVADLIPGSIDGREDVRIASGEYVIPAWAVAALGDGSTEAGAKVLDAMVARLREEGSQRIMGSEPINPSEFLPA